MTADASTGPDARTLLGTSLDQMDAVLAAVPPETLPLPTPCSEYDVRTLVGHLLSVVRRLAHVSTGGDPFDVPSVATDDLTQTGWLAEYRSARADVDRIWADDAVLDRMMTVPWGEAPGRAVALGYAMEMTVHAWDLVRATGQPTALDPALAESALGFVGDFLPAQPRGGQVPFDPVVTVAEDADAYQRLVGWLGRQP